VSSSTRCKLLARSRSSRVAFRRRFE
jgi:hypothetical protein